MPVRVDSTFIFCQVVKGAQTAASGQVWVCVLTTAMVSVNVSGSCYH